MNESIPPPLIPRSIAVPPTADDPADRAPVTHALTAFEAILRQPQRIIHQLTQPDAGRLIARLVLIAVAFSLGYGVVVGAFSGGEQWWAAPFKICAGLLASAVICLPSLYILACLGGSRASLVEVGGLVAGLLALMTILLIGFAPVAWVFSQSTESVVAMGALHLIFALIAVGFGLRLLILGFGRLGGNSNGGLVIWAIIFLLVLLQMSTALRPLVGTADTFLPTEKKFFLSHWRDSIDNDGEKPAAPSGR